MREHLFRGFSPNKNGNTKIILNGETIKGDWVYGSYVDTGEEYTKDRVYAIFEKDTEHVCMGEYKDIGWHEVLPETVGEYTGLTDKNGKKIFEGDIVKGDLGIGQVLYGRYQFSACDEYGCKHYGYYVKTRRKIGLRPCNDYAYLEDELNAYDLAKDSVEVIGNIHETLDKK